MGGACFMHVPSNVTANVTANVHNVVVLLSERIQVWFRSSLRILLRGLSHKSSIAFLLTE
jgi:hypothetical protein